MFLKSVELFGFKSFADRSKIEFDEGISALLGPNGCGKSNVVDALKWVLGEQSTRTLRADKMEDVIFNGTESRKALSVAEVTLVLSNDEGILPIDLPEIAVKRRLYRSGESEYSINGAPVRLREVRELFFDTGIGKSAYSIMEQGRIDQILSSKPEERRYVFEEAAGITKYKARGAEAERKLQRTVENIRQIESIIKEVRRSHDTLKAQSDKTVLYRQSKEKEFDLELELHLLRLRGFLDKQHKTEQSIASTTSDRDKLKKEIDGLNESLEENIDQVNSMESNLIEMQRNLYGIDLERRGRSSRIDLLSDRKHEVQRSVDSRVQRADALDKRLGDTKRHADEQRAKLAGFGKKLKEIDENIRSFDSDITIAQNRIKQNDSSISGIDTRILNHESTLENLQNDLQMLYDGIAEELDKGLKESGYALGARKDAEEELDRLVNELSIQARGKRDLSKDIAKSDTLSPQILEFLDVLPQRIEEIQSRYGEFKAAVPTFLDDFLAPEGILTRKREVDAKVESLRLEIRKEREARVKLVKENKTLGIKIEEYRKTLEELRVGRAQAIAQRSALEDSLDSLKRQIGEQTAQIEENTREIAEAKRSIDDIVKQTSALEKEIAAFNAKEGKLNNELAKLEKGITNRNQDVTSKEKRLKKRIASLGDRQAAIERLNIDLASVATEIRNVYENFRDSHSRELSEYESTIYEIKSDIDVIRKNLLKTKETIRNLGSVNLMAPEEFTEVKERFEFLTTQLKDLKTAQDDLKQITEQIKTESGTLFLETYERIKKNFHMMFRRLFGGGRGELRLTQPNSVLDSGIEIYAQPPGKKLENISLLSGGERSLTAVAMLFATYMVRPSPFCVLDEIDAALDEENVSRFVSLLQEFAQNSQFIVITHNKRTVAGARALLGVTMEESGVSKIISVRLENREMVRA